MNHQFIYDGRGRIWKGETFHTVHPDLEKRLKKDQPLTEGIDFKLRPHYECSRNWECDCENGQPCRHPKS